ncbi:Hsp20/alpha crystallin family protein [Clostridium sp.]|uniref:Hsp20/alpha crystallin family protein n=1 Tax=Clostridium sp. TaxID=1506 RepID=UPI003F34675D
MKKETIFALTELIQNNSLKKNNNPIINITQNEHFYNIYIYLRDLKKDEICLKYINNFLIMNFSLKTLNDELLTYKRSFYLKDIDIDKSKNIASANLVYLKVPKIVTSQF